MGKQLGNHAGVMTTATPNHSGLSILGSGNQMRSTVLNIRVLCSMPADQMPACRVSPAVSSSN